MLNFGNKEFRNLQEQVLYLSNRSNFGLNIKGEVETVPQLGDIPNTNIGDVYLVGKAAPFNFYIKTADKTWTNLGKLESNVPGPQGLQGIQGIKGTDGSVIYTNNQPESANNGDLYISNDGKLYQYDNEWKLVTSLRGSIGPVGPKGPEGPRGLQGERGERGEKGDTGIGIRIGGNVATEDLLPAKPVGDTNAYLVGQGSPYELYVWNGTGWLNSGEFGTLDNIQVITINAPETATSGQLDAGQLNQVIESTSALIKHGNLIYRKEAVISTKAIYRCITDDSLYIISVNTDTGSWVKEEHVLSQYWDVTDIPNGGIVTDYLADSSVTIPKLDAELKETIFEISPTLTEVVNRYEYFPANANLYTVNIESGKLTFSGTPSTKATLFVYYEPSIKFEASKPVYLNIYADKTSVVPRECYITIGGKQMELYPLLNKSTELKIDTTLAHDKFAIYNNALSAINFSGYIWLSTKPMSTYLSPNAAVSRIAELEKVVYKKREDKPIIIFNSDMGAILDNRVKVLEEFGFKGTFCDNGTKWTKDVLKRLLSKGHDIALYGGGNVPSANQPSDWQNEEQWRTYLTANLKAMNDNGYYLPTLFGCTTHKGTEIIKKVTKELGFKYMSCGYITPGDSWETPGTKFYTWKTNSPNEYVISPTKIEDITPEWFDTTFLPQGNILSIFNHTVIDGEITNPTLQVSTTKYREIVQKVKELVDEGKVEVLTMREMYNRYHKEDGQERDFNRLMTMAV